MRSPAASVLLLAFALAQISTAQAPVTPARTGASQVPPDYVLGGGDLLQIDVPDLGDEFTPDKSFRIGASGLLGLPYAGRVQAAGLTVPQFEDLLKSRLKDTLNNPDVTVTVTGFGSQPVSVLGAVKLPGLVQIAGNKNLFEVISMAGGLSDSAGYEINITRELKWGELPLPGSHIDESGEYSVASVKVSDLLDSSKKSKNLPIMPNDKISVPPSDLVYAVGDLLKPGGFQLNEHESLSAMQVVSLAQGFGKAAAPQNAKILRIVPGSPNRTEIAVNLAALMTGKIPDFQLHPQDILFVPTSKAKNAGYKMLDVVNAASGSIVYALIR